MLGIIVMIGIAYGFYKAAKKRNLNGALYAVLSIATWYVAQVIVAFTMLESSFTMGEIIVGSLIGSIGAVGILHVIMVQAGNKKAQQGSSLSDEIMDDFTIDDL